MKEGSVAREVIEWLVHITLAVVFTLLTVNYIGQFTIVRGNSMFPTIKNNSVLVIEKLSKHFGRLEQGDIVVLKIPEFLDGDKTFAVKRIIAGEGQQISIRKGSVYVDGDRLNETYINGTDTLAAAGMYDDITVPEGYVYILGDNRLPGASKDSRTFGPVAVNRIEGRVVFRLFPFREAGGQFGSKGSFASF